MNLNEMMTVRGVDEDDADVKEWWAGLNADEIERECRRRYARQEKRFLGESESNVTVYVADVNGNAADTVDEGSDANPTDVKALADAVRSALVKLDATRRRGQPSKYVELWDAMLDCEWNEKTGKPNMLKLAGTLKLSRARTEGKYVEFLEMAKRNLDVWTAFTQALADAKALKDATPEADA